MEVTLGPLSSVPAGEGRTFDVGRCRVAVFHARSGEVFATQAECPHRGGPLADGLIGGRTLVCPLHAWTFDLGTGEAADGRCSLATYPARVNRAGHIVVDI